VAQHRQPAAREVGALWTDGLNLVTCSPILSQRELESFGVRPHAGRGAGEPFISDIGGLLPMALCGRTSL
jgi:hypothetical protein